MARVVSGIIAVFLLGLYGYAISVLVATPSTEPSSQVATILNLVGGLVSALVVAVLAITPPGDDPTRALLEPTSMSVRIVTVITWAYLVVWIACGGVLLFSWMRTDGAAESLSAAATSWLGLAVAAAYSYLGLKQPERS